MKAASSHHPSYTFVNCPDSPLRNKAKNALSLAIPLHVVWRGKDRQFFAFARGKMKKKCVSEKLLVRIFRFIYGRDALAAIETIVLPSDYIILDVIGDKAHFVMVADDVVVKTRLPCKRKVVFVRKFGDTNLETTNHRCQVFRLWPKFLFDLL